MDMSTPTALKTGDRVLVPWGVSEDREGIVVEVWGDPKAPSHIRVELVPLDPEDEPSVLLLNPGLVTAAA